MTLAELINEVYTLTNRPDRVNETASAIRSATLKAHQSDYFYKDIFETGVNCGAANYENDIDYRQLIPTWRSVKYIRKYFLPGSSTAPQVLVPTPGKLLTLVEPANVFDDYQQQKQDVYYIAASMIHINSSTQDQYYLLGCYVNPNITTAGYNSWIAVDNPYAIIFDAAATVFKSVGKDEETAAYKVLVAEQLALLKTTNIVANGF